MRMSTIISTLLFAKILHKYTTNIQNREYNFAVDESCNFTCNFYITIAQLILMTGEFLRNFA
jgi:glycopeptide antibiotics resistance protein